MRKDDTVYLWHILDAIGQIEDYLKGVSEGQFLQNRLLQDGVVRQLEIIGEDSRNLSGEFQKEHPEVPWRQIIALRNRIIHAYFTVNLQIVWEVARDDLPSLKQQVKRILERR
ncbi:MAG: HepT-like ribonuclease domain-containing protein [Anaerolineae bacterium]